MSRASRVLNYATPALSALSENTYLSAIRAGMVAVVPLTIIGGLFLILANIPFERLKPLLAPHAALLNVPVTATFGVLGLVACFAIAYDLAVRLKIDGLSSAIVGTAVFLVIQVNPADQSFVTDGLGSKGLFTAILIAVFCVRVQKLFADSNLVIRLPPSVPPIVYESFLSLVPLFVLVVFFWLVRHVAKVDINAHIQSAFKPLLFALNTLPGILVYGFLVTLLWSVGIHGDNALDAVVAPIFLQFLAENTAAFQNKLPPPYITANGFFSTFVNVGGTGATIALALVLAFSREPGLRKVSRLSLPTQVFQINEPIMFGVPVVLNPVLMVPYVLTALVLTAGTYLLMQFGLIGKPVVAVPWTTPPVIGHYLVTGGDWRAAVWGMASIGLAMMIYFPFAKAAERMRLAEESKAAAAGEGPNNAAM